VSYDNDLMAGAAQLLADAGVARWIPTGVYPSSGLPAVFIRAMPDSPDDAISLATYPVQPAIAPDDEVIGLQVRIRADGSCPAATDEFVEQVRQVLHNLRGHLGTVPITLCAHQSGASLGQDDRDRWGWSSNFYITAPRPTPHFH